MNHTHERALHEIQRGLELLPRLKVSHRGPAACVQASGVPIGPASYAVLSLLARTGPLPMGKIAQAAAMDRTATTRAAERLHRAGYVHRLADRRDRRRVVLAMTWRGMKAHRSMTAETDRYFSAALKGWEASDVERFACLLTTFVTDAASRELGTGSPMD